MRAISAATALTPGATSLRARAKGANPRRVSRVSTTRAAIVDPPKTSIKDVQRPDETGRFGAYGGKYVPETLIPALQELQDEYATLAGDASFQVRVT